MEQIKEYEYVDLGLPSGLKWAKCNVGAEKETDYGDYFQWGSITPNTDTPCDWINAPFNNGSSDYDETYFNSVKDDVCPNGILAKKYDAASQIMGDEWRMPTEAEFQELIDNTSIGWYYDFNGSGVSGWIFRSKTDTSKYIFIPAAGNCNYGSVNGVGNYGGVWTSSLGTSYLSDAWYLYFASGSRAMGFNSHYYGLPVRGVFK